ncbi:5,10-methylenetetrahydrofolate reductase isoform X1 [Drosophila willistoni]|uniref:5,10-methylenetetrahydrofolate reductase isoform X1 n=1 Tax=Drosophila willistoni TaxID=7260 RepID=UPI000C26CD49|nr:5,10-methylenetetrahydrofolate reductase isoform X1 [Drosophila willistoni]
MFPPVNSSSGYEPCVKFAPSQLSSSERRTNDIGLGSLIENLTARQEFFYGIEISALTANQPTCLDFNEFLPTLPAFVSLVWLGISYWNIPMDENYSLQLAKHMESHIPVLAHLSAYRMTEERLNEFLAKNFRNVLIVRGDEIHEGQKFTYGREMIEYARQQRKADNLSIGVPGYPEGYHKNPINDPILNIQYLKEKISAGGEFIITQTCYSSQKIIQFINDCREANVTVPIIIGIMVPDSVRNYHIVKNITGARLPNEVNDLSVNADDILKFFVDLTVRNIRDIFTANLGIQGIQFFTMNRFRPVQMVLDELRTLKILQ